MLHQLHINPTALLRVRWGGALVAASGRSASTHAPSKRVRRVYLIFVVAFRMQFRMFSHADWRGPRAVVSQLLFLLALLLLRRCCESLRGRRPSPSPPPLSMNLFCRFGPKSFRAARARIARRGVVVLPCPQWKIC